MKSLLTRLEALEAAQKVKDELREIARIKAMPVLTVAPWTLIKDEIKIQYFPFGKEGKCYTDEVTTIQGVMDFLQTVSEDCYIDLTMGMCLEWLYIFHEGRRDPTAQEGRPQYSQEQIDRATQQWLTDYPELVNLDTDEGRELTEVLRKIPQSMLTTAGAWLHKLNEGKV